MIHPCSIVLCLPELLPEFVTKDFKEPSVSLIPLGRRDTRRITVRRTPRGERGPDVVEVPTLGVTLPERTPKSPAEYQSVPIPPKPHSFGVVLYLSVESRVVSRFRPWFESTGDQDKK